MFSVGHIQTSGYQCSVMNKYQNYLHIPLLRVFVILRKKTSTEPKSLSKSKAQPVVNNGWYIGGIDDDCEVSNLSVTGGRLHHAATTELLQTTGGQTMLSAVSSAEWCIYFRFIFV